MNHEDKSFWDMIVEEWTAEERLELLTEALVAQDGFAWSPKMASPDAR